jgi:hypothetical protein
MKTTITDPVRVFRSKSYVISTYIAFNCDKTLNNTKSLTIRKCLPNNNTRSCLYDYEDNQTSSYDFDIQEKTRNYGLYQLIYKLLMGIQPTTNIASIDTFILITRTPVVVNLLQNGTSMISRGINQTLILWPGAYSVDPDSLLGFVSTVCLNIYHSLSIFLF